MWREEKRRTRKGRLARKYGLIGLIGFAILSLSIISYLNFFRAGVENLPPADTATEEQLRGGSIRDHLRKIRDHVSQNEHVRSVVKAARDGHLDGDVYFGHTVKALRDAEAMPQVVGANSDGQTEA